MGVLPFIKPNVTYLSSYPYWVYFHQRIFEVQRHLETFRNNLEIFTLKMLGVETFYWSFQRRNSWKNLFWGMYHQVKLGGGLFEAHQHLLHWNFSDQQIDATDFVVKLWCHFTHKEIMSVSHWSPTVTEPYFHHVANKRLIQRMRLVSRRNGIAQAVVLPVWLRF